VQPNRDIRRQHSVCRSDKKRIAEAIPQAPQGMTDGWLRQAEAIARCRKTAEIPDCEENPKKIQIDMIIRPAHTVYYNYEFDFGAMKLASSHHE
jgi:hypothetical protein